LREVPIEPALLPLLERMHEDAQDDAPILPVLGTLNDKFRAKQLRKHLEVAGVNRDRLFANTVTLLSVTFRSCRDTGITRLALAPPEKPRETVPEEGVEPEESQAVAPCSRGDRGC
jgi:hypothetical protein